MKVYIYKKNYEQKKRERVGIVKNVISIQSTQELYLIGRYNEIIEIPRNEYMISVYGY